MTKYTKEFFDRQKDASYTSASVVVPIVMEYVSPKSVVDVGCGVGTWLSVFNECGVDDILGVDGPWIDGNQLFIPKEKFMHRDFEKPFEISKTADLVISLEMAEHIPDSSADGLVKSLTSIAPVVFFSAAIPLQGGVNHVNEQWPSYWAKKFKARGYVPVDCIRRKIWMNENVRFWYAQNSFFYVAEKHLSEYPKLEQEIKNGNGEALALVHPVKYMRAIERHQTLLPSLKLFLVPLKGAVRKFLVFIRKGKIATM